MRLDQLIQGNDVVQRHVASERQALVAISPKAREAVREEILPQIEESVFSLQAAEDLCDSTKRAIEAAFSFKNEIYNRLISYKGIDQSDQQYLSDLLLVMDEWHRHTKARLKKDEDGNEDDEKFESSKSTSSKDQEVNVSVNVNVNGEEQTAEVEKETSDDEEDGDPKEASEDVLIAEASAEEDVPMSFDEIFDVQDVRI